MEWLFVISFGIGIYFLARINSRVKESEKFIHEIFSLLKKQHDSLDKLENAIRLAQAENAAGNATSPLTTEAAVTEAAVIEEATQAEPAPPFTAKTEPRQAEAPMVFSPFTASPTAAKILREEKFARSITAPTPLPETRAANQDILPEAAPGPETTIAEPALPPEACPPLQATPDTAIPDNAAPDTVSDNALPGYTAPGADLPPETAPEPENATPHKYANAQELVDAIAAGFKIKPELPGLIKLAADFIRAGNIWVTGGVLFMLLGFAFLLTYMADKGVFTLEMRIVFAALSGMVMCGAGLYLRRKAGRRVYALVLQGGGIGVLYLSTFAASRLTDLLPPVAALVIMSLLVVPAVALALAQNAQIMALVAFLGGFAAPVLVSTGSNNYIALFSYYTLLDLGILLIARYRLWRWVNLLGLVCSFGIMALWGLESYVPANYPAVQGFLLVFLAIFTILGLVASGKEEFYFSYPPDIFFICALPPAAAVFQAYLATATNMPSWHLLTVSALGFGAVFIALGAWLLKCGKPKLRPLVEFYLLFGIVAANMAIPLEFSQQVSSAMWAVEGALLFHMACRHSSVKLKALALLIIFTGVASSLTELQTAPRPILVCGLITLSTLASAWRQQRFYENAPEKTWDASPILANALAYCGMLWWLFGLLAEADNFPQPQITFLVAAVTLSGLVFYLAGQKSRVEACKKAIYAALPAAPAFLLFHVAGEIYYQSPGHAISEQFFAGPGALAWLGILAGQMLLIYFSRKEKSRLLAIGGGLVSLQIIFLLGSSLRAVVVKYLSMPGLDDLAIFLPSFIFLAGVCALIQKKRLDETRLAVMFFYVPCVLFTAMGLWFLASLIQPGGLFSSLYLPVLNPLELCQLACIALFACWQTLLRRFNPPEIPVPALPRVALFLIFDGLLFIWLHNVLIRLVFHIHFEQHGAGITLDALVQPLCQMLISVLWGLWAAAHIIVGNKKARRYIWFIGLGLIIAVTGKLFLVDLADKGTLMRVLSFFALGAIFLVIGWLSPLPPAKKDTEQTEKTEEQTA